MPPPPQRRKQAEPQLEPQPEFKCEICGKVFTNPRSLPAHRQHCRLAAKEKEKEKEKKQGGKEAEEGEKEKKESQEVYVVCSGSLDVSTTGSLETPLNGSLDDFEPSSRALPPKPKLNPKPPPVPRKLVRLDEDPDVQLIERPPSQEMSNSDGDYAQSKTLHLCSSIGCSSSFSSAAGLRQHALTTHERPYKCTHPNCTRSFSVRQHLQMHVELKHAK